MQSRIDISSSEQTGTVSVVPKEIQNEVILAQIIKLFIYKFLSTCSKCFQLTKLTTSEQEKRREIDKLKNELGKAHFEIQQLEERVQCDQQLLKVRSELISSLQSNEKSHRIHVDELFVNVAERSNTINEVCSNALGEVVR